MYKKIITIIGHYGRDVNFLDGQTIKTKIVTREIERNLEAEQIRRIDTYSGKKKLFIYPLTVFNALRRSSNIIILPAHNGLRIIAPLLTIENKIFHRKLHYVVIGGWLPDFLKKRKRLAKELKKFDFIYVETTTMKKALEIQGFKNVLVMPNCKELKILKEEELVYPQTEPYKLCTFSRVMREKGIEDAVNAVREVNEHYGRTVYALDIYGQVDSAQTEWFDELQKTFPDYVRYGGCVAFDRSVDVLKDYFALLFPTYYDGEGFAGTIIDAFSAGVPVLASDWKYNSELIKENYTGRLFEAKNTDDLVRVLKDIINNPQKWSDMKNNCVDEANKYLPSKAIEPLLQNLVLE